LRTGAGLGLDRTRRIATRFKSYTAALLASGQRYHWQVRIWNGTGRFQLEPAGFWEMACSGRRLDSRLDQSGWDENTATNPSPCAKEFCPGRTGAIRAALREQLGLYEAELKRPAASVTTFYAGLDRYGQRIHYQT